MEEDKIINILKEYQSKIKHDKLNFNNYTEQTIFFEIDFFVKLLNEKKEYN